MTVHARSLIAPSLLPRLLAAGVLLLASSVAHPVHAEPIVGDGLRPGALWPHWQGRVALSAAEPTWDRPLRSPRPSFALLGDYYLTRPDLVEPGHDVGGLRATGGLLIGRTTTPWQGSTVGTTTQLASMEHRLGLQPDSSWIDASDGLQSRPYLGVGYSGLRALGQAGWGFSADVGVVALRPRSMVRLGQQGMGDLLRDMQLSPVLQVGVSYAF